MKTNAGVRSQQALTNADLCEVTSAPLFPRATRDSQDSHGRSPRRRTGKDRAFRTSVCFNGRSKALHLHFPGLFEGEVQALNRVFLFGRVMLK